jgi:hypothetical protein
MQFLGPTKRWIQSVTDELKTMKWSQSCQALHTRFDCDQHEFLLRKMNRICQTSSVQDYVDRFSELVDQLKAYDSSTSALHYITCFLDGLHSDIRVVLLVQRPILWTLRIPWRCCRKKRRSHQGSVILGNGIKKGDTRFLTSPC